MSRSVAGSMPDEGFPLTPSVAKVELVIALALVSVLVLELMLVLVLVLTLACVIVAPKLSLSLLTVSFDDSRPGQVSRTHARMSGERSRATRSALSADTFCAAGSRSVSAASTSAGLSKNRA
jgi:hypothetical protein